MDPAERRLSPAEIDALTYWPGLVPSGAAERHPFGAVLTALMDARGLSRAEMARRCGRAQSTIEKVRSGFWNPHRILVTELAAALEMPERDLLAIAGLDAQP